ncbi:MAG: hypothetical protein WAL31_13755 [Gaiellaceae bacterium]
MSPLLTARPTFPPVFSCASAFGVWEITRPSGTVFENLRFTEPTLNPAALIACSADFRVLPVTFGTGGALPNDAVTERAELIVTVHRPAPVQAPDQPENDDADAAIADSVTCVPLA